MTGSDWEIVGSNPEAGVEGFHSFIKERNVSETPQAEIVLHLFSNQQDHLVAYSLPCVSVVKKFQKLLYTSKS